jgi:DNA-binding IclR family transcriptional regulator
VSAPHKRFADHSNRSLLARVDAVLGAFDADHSSLSLQGIVARTGLPKTTAHRSIQRMLELKWLERHGGRYSIGTRFFEIGALAFFRMTLREAALPFMQDLYEATHETIHLAIMDGTQILYVEKIVGHRRITNQTRVGGHMPAHCTALGKVLTAFSCHGTAEPTIPTELRVRTPGTIVSAAKMRAELARIRELGVGFDHEECEIGVECVAAPVTAADGSCVAALSIAGPAHHLNLTQLAPAVRHAAVHVSRALVAFSAT